MAEFNGVDYVILGIFFLSVLAGIFRGLVKEVILLITWIAALIIATQFSAPLASAFTHSDKVKSAISTAATNLSVNPEQSVSWLAVGVSFIVIFIIVMLIGSFVGSLFSRVVDSTVLGIGNRLFGGFFGFLRGYLINLTLIFLMQLVPSVNEQDWWKNSILIPQFHPGVTWLSQVVQPGIETLKTKVSDTMQDVTGSLQKAAGKI